MSSGPCVLCGVLGALITLLITPWLLKNPARLNAGRRRDLHHSGGAEISRLGGLGLAAAYIGVQLFLAVMAQPNQHWLVATAPLAMFALGLWDDLESVAAKTKLVGQVLIAFAVAAGGVTLEVPKPVLLEGWVATETYRVLLTMAWLVAFTNLINLVDGVDGLAVSLTIVGMLVVTSLTWRISTVTCLSLGMLGALVPVFRYNFPPARIYLGDGGAYLLGFQLGLFSILGYRASGNTDQLILPLVGLVLPIMDTVFAVARRGASGLPVFRPDRHHLHHELLRAGMTPRRVVLWYSLLTGSFICAASAAVIGPRRYLLVSLCLGTSFLLVAFARNQRILLRWLQLAMSLRASMGMRQQIGYAFCLKHWLRHEAERCCSVEELFADLRLAARRLGFTSVRLTLADGYRLWKEPDVRGPWLSICHRLESGDLGVLELEAPRRRFRLRSSPFQLDSGPRSIPAPNDPKLFEILGELLAESWVEATRSWHLGRVRLRFDHPLPQIYGVQRRQPPAGPGSTGIINAQSWEPNRVAASSAERLLRPTCGLAISALLVLCASRGLCDTAEPTLEALTNVARMELPARAACFVKLAPPAHRYELTRKLIKLAKQVNPALVAPMVSSISKTLPEMAPLASGAAVMEQPDMATAIATAAAGSAPTQTRAIVSVVCRAVPADYKRVATEVFKTVPESGRDILEAVSLVFPELRGAIQSRLTHLTGRPSVPAVLDSISLSGIPKPLLDRVGIPRLKDSPQTPAPSIGPPFVPLSGTATNVDSSTSGTVPKGGRNYAKP